jgi:SAM-dependent methyltransferase
MTSVDDDPRRTRPGTSMIGPYSVHQMDDFYAALAVGQVKPTGVMNLMQKLLITERCRPGDAVVDVCCGSGLQLPVLYRNRADLRRYVGLDVSAANLRAGGDRKAALDARYGARFPVEFHRVDVAEPWPDLGVFDVAVYTSALEHLPREQGAASLRNTAAALSEDGRLFLSTPNTAGEPPRRLQHRVYEWCHDELIEALDEAGLVVQDVVGILAPEPERVEQALTEIFGPQAARLYARLREFVPPQILGPVIAAAVEGEAAEVLYICTRRPS